VQSPWRRWRPVTRFIIGVNLVFPLWVLHGLQPHATLSCAKAVYNNCVPSATAASSPLIPMLTMWLFADIFLLVGWAISRPRRKLSGPSPFS